MQPNETPGDTYGRWTVIGPSFPVGRRSFIRCRCRCGTERDVEVQSLRSGQSSSCGCLRRERASETNRTHGESPWVNGGTAEYRAWAQMIDRCKNDTLPEWNRYGGRGITVCSKWRNSYESFLADLGRRPSPGHSVDRINNDGNYEPRNSRGATRSEQARNMRSNRRLTIDGRIMTVVEWSESSGVPSQRIYSRLHRGWPEREAVMLRPRSGLPLRRRLRETEVHDATI